MRALTQGRGVDHVLEVGGAGTLGQSLQSAARNAQVSLIGVLAGVDERLDIRPILMKMIRVQGIFVGPVAMLRELADTLSRGGVHPVIDRTYDFRETPAALREMQSGAHFGKIVIQVS